MMMLFSRSSKALRAAAERIRIFPNPWLILVLGAAVTFGAWWETRRTIEQNAHEAFAVEIGQVQSAILNRMHAYRQMLTAGASFVAIKGQVSRDELAAFIEKLGIAEQYPGMQGTGYAQYVRHKDKAAYIAAIRASGLPEYDIRPPGERAEYVVILYNEPFVGRNQKVLGFDMYANEVRREAIERARDLALPAMSGKVVLAGEKPEAKSPAAILNVPVYEKNRPLATVAERQAALRGFVFAPFRMHDLMAGIIGREKPSIRFAIFDGAAEAAETLMYDSAATVPGQLTASDSRFQHMASVEIAGRTWSMRFTGTAEFDAAVDRDKPLIVLGGGLVISLLTAAVAAAARRARHEAQRFRDFAELGSDWFWEQDEARRFTYISPRFIEFIGVQSGEFIGRSRREIVGRYIRPGEDIERHLAAIDRGEPFQNVEMTAISARGERIARLSGKPILSQDGRFAGYRGVGHDVTEERRRERELEAARVAAESASRAKSDFLTMMSHEIRPPMTAIIGMGGLLLDTPLAPNQRQYADTIRTAGDTLLSLTNNILDLSKLEAGQLDFEESRFDLASLAQGVVDMTKSIAGRKTLDIHLQIDPAAPRWFLGDSGRIRQILLNLAANAVKFTDRGSVTIRTGAVRRADARHDVRIEVIDTGIGIESNDIERLFQPFTQGDASITRRFGGTGLGLSIARELVVCMGGDIGAASEPGKGSTFWFTLPLLSADAPRATAATGAMRSPDAAARRLRVLIAEDNLNSQKYVQIVVETAGHRADTVLDGKEAVRAAAENVYDVILMDVQMPNLDGFEATRRIRAMGAAAATLPIIAMTASVLPEVVAKCREAGMNDYIAKPFHRETLEYRLARIAASLALPEPP